MTEPERLLKPAEVADLLGVPVQTLYAWRQKGYGPRAARVGRHLRWREVDVRAWVIEQLDDPEVIKKRRAR